MSSPDAPISTLDEDGLVSLLKERFPAPAGDLGIGDDAAAFPAPTQQIVFTTDAMVEGVHFDLAYFSGADLGWKAMAINASDIAAMAGVPWKGLLTLCLPVTTTVGFVQDLIQGIAEAADEMGIAVAGGDISSADRMFLGAALLGTVDDPITRSGARVGDAICVTGTLGGSHGGLALLQKDASAEGPLVARHRRPRPRLLEARALKELRPTAMLDVSDGLVVDLHRLLVASDKGCEVDPGLIPVDPNLPNGDDKSAALFGGEDFELLFTLAPEQVPDAAAALGGAGTEVTQIGVVTDGDRLIGARSLTSLKEHGWDHLQSR